MNAFEKRTMEDERINNMIRRIATVFIGVMIETVALAIAPDLWWVWAILILPVFAFAMFASMEAIDALLALVYATCSGIIVLSMYLIKLLVAFVLLIIDIAINIG